MHAHTHSHTLKSLTCIFPVAGLSRAESTASRTEETDGWRVQGKVRQTKGEKKVWHLRGQTSAGGCHYASSLPSRHTPSQYTTSQTIHVTDWPRQALSWQRCTNWVPLAVFLGSGWQGETETWSMRCDIHTLLYSSAPDSVLLREDYAFVGNQGTRPWCSNMQHAHVMLE